MIEIKINTIHKMKYNSSVSLTCNLKDVDNILLKFKEIYNMNYYYALLRDDDETVDMSLDIDNPTDIKLGYINLEDLK